MSRVGRNHIDIPSGVTVTFDKHICKVNGQLGTMQLSIKPEIDVKIDGNKINVINIGDKESSRALHGLSRQLINNMVVGVSKGYKKSLNVNGVGFKVTQNGQDLTLNIGFSHPVIVKAVEGIKLSCDKNLVVVEGIDKEKVGQFAARVRSIKPVEPYHAYGISYTDEVVVRKEVKSGKK